MVCAKLMTSDKGSEFELPKTWFYQHAMVAQTLRKHEHTAIAVTKFFCGNFRIPNTRTIILEERKDTSVWTRRMIGMIASSKSLSPSSCFASFEKTK